MAKVTLGEVLDQCEKLGQDLAIDKPLIDLKGLIPMKDHHQTAVFIRLPGPNALKHKAAVERVMKLLTSINRPDTIKADVFTVLGGNCQKGYQPTIKYPVVDGDAIKGSLFNPDWVIAEAVGYVLQIVVDIVHPEVLAEAAGVQYDPAVDGLPPWAKEKMANPNKNNPFLVEGEVPAEAYASIDDDDDDDELFGDDD